MRLETFFEKFDLFADAPDAVAKMRGLILRLAMHGKLSEPHATDGPVGQLLREVEKDRVRLGLESSAKSTSGNSEFSDDKAADVIPARWTWVRFGNIARHNAGKTLDKGRNRGQLRDYITTSNLYWGFFQLDAVRQMPILDDELERCTAIKGDLLICEGGEAGRAAVWPHDREISFQNHVHRARFFADINPYFVQRYFEKLNATGEIDKYRKGVGISNMSGKALASIPIPLPPLAEQKRIVAKVDELMALCDRLEAQQQERETRHAALARASLARFADAPTAASLDLLFHKSYSIPPADLRKSILTLAVQGKLVPQDPNDEPAQALLERVASTAKTRARVSDSLDARHAPFSIPESWAWVRLPRVLKKLTDGTHHSPPNGPSGAFMYVTAKNIKADGVLLDGITYVSKEVHDEIYSRCDPSFGDVLYIKDGATTGIAAINQVKEPFSMLSSVALLKPSDAIFNRYLLWAMRSPFFYEETREAMKGAAITRVTLSVMAASLIPLPPLDEQYRVVAKVDELMALVDAMETQLATKHKAGSQLVDALVTELTQRRALA